MNDTLSVLEPTVVPRAPKNGMASPELRKEVHNMLRDVAFVLAANAPGPRRDASGDECPADRGRLTMSSHCRPHVPFFARHVRSALA